MVNQVAVAPSTMRIVPRALSSPAQVSEPDRPAILVLQLLRRCELLWQPRGVAACMHAQVRQQGVSAPVQRHASQSASCLVSGVCRLATTIDLVAIMVATADHFLTMPRADMQHRRAVPAARRLLLGITGPR